MSHAAFNPDLTAMLLHNVFADGQPQSGTAFFPGIGYIHLLELLEDHVEFVGGDASPLVGDGEQEEER